METTLKAPLNKAQHDILPLLANIKTQEELDELRQVVLAFCSTNVAALFTGHTTTLTDEELDQMKYEYLAEKYL